MPFFFFFSAQCESVFTQTARELLLNLGFEVYLLWHAAFSVMDWQTRWYCRDSQRQHEEKVMLPHRCHTLSPDCTSASFKVGHSVWEISTCIIFCHQSYWVCLQCHWSTKRDILCVDYTNHFMFERRCVRYGFLSVLCVKSPWIVFSSGSHLGKVNHWALTPWVQSGLFPTLMHKLDWCSSVLRRAS